MAAHTVAFFGNLAGLWGAEGAQDRLNLLGLLSAGWVLGNLGFYRLSRGKLLKGTLALLLALLFINVMILLFFAA